MVKFCATIKAIVTRLVFAFHGVIAIWEVTVLKKNSLFWYLSCPIFLLFFEGIFTITIKENQEWKWFCPSVFLYLSSVVPAIWLLELDKVEKRLKTFETNVNISRNFNSTLTVLNLKHLEKALRVNIHLPDIQIPTESWVTFIEQFLMLILIIGRWMLPKGELTRDQLSQLLLAFIGTAADIIEFFDSFKEDRIAREPVLVYLTLGIWAWSLLQFTVVLTATKSRKSRLTSGSVVKRKTHTETSCCNIDVWGIAMNMVLQDGPFLAFRLLLIIHYRIISYMNIFFTCKNTLVILLQLYRLCVLQTGTKDKKDENVELGNISSISKVVKKRKEHEDVKPDEFVSSSRNINRSKRKLRQDTGYSTSSINNIYSEKREILNGDKRCSRSSAKKEIKRKPRKIESSPRTITDDSEEESLTNRAVEYNSSSRYESDSEESESVPEKKRYVHRKQRQNRG